MEIGDKKDMQKNGVDYLIKQGYKNLSNKTFISDRDLEQFLNKDFTNVNKTRALGFIQILEREYDVDLGELRSAYLDHEGTVKPRKVEKLFIERPIEEENLFKKYLPYIAGALAIFGLAFLLFRPSMEVGQTPEPLIKQTEKNQSVIDEAQKNIEKLEINKSANSVLENSLEKEKNVSSVPTAPINEDLDLDKVVLQMMQDRNLSMKENNITLDINSTVKTVEKKEVEVTKQVKTKKVTTDAKLTPKKTDDIPIAKTFPIEPKVKKTKKQKVENRVIAGGNLYIDPTQKAWVGVIYLDNFSKKDFLIRDKLPLDANRNQLIVVGHGNFKIYNKTYSVKFRGRGPVRFIYRDGELMEISKKEFVNSSKGVAW